MSGHRPWLLFAVWFALFAGCFVSAEVDLFATASLALGLATVATTTAVAVAKSSPRLRPFLIGLYGGVAGIGVLAVLAYGFYLRQSGPIGADVVRAIAQTDYVEAFGYIVTSASWPKGAALVIIGVLLILTFQAAASTVNYGTREPRILWAAAALGISFTVAGGVPVFKPILSFIAEYKAEAAQFKAVVAKRRTKTPSGVQSNFEGTIIVIIGESTTRRHMGLYGYIRDTTPLLSQRRHELVVFRDAISPDSHTVPVLTQALTLEHFLS